MNRRMRRQMVRSRRALNTMQRRRVASDQAPEARPWVREHLTEEQLDEVLEHDADRARRLDRR